MLVVTNFSAVSKNRFRVSMRRCACCWSIVIDERSYSPAVEVQLVITTPTLPLRCVSEHAMVLKTIFPSTDTPLLIAALMRWLFPTSAV